MRSCICAQGLDLLARMLSYDPDERISAYKASFHNFFYELPRPAAPEEMPIGPSDDGYVHKDKKK